MTRHLSEDMLDTLAREGVDDNDHLRVCQTCRSRYSLFVRLYEELRDMEDDRVDTRVPLLAGAFGSAGGIVLTPYQAPVNHAILSNSREVSVLAAQTEAPEGARFLSVATFVAGAHGILMKVTRDSETKSYLLQALSDQQSQLGHILVGVSLPGAGPQVLLTDAHGRAVLRSDQEHDWQHATVVVNLPNAVISLRDVADGQTAYRRLNVSVELRCDESSCVIKVRKPKTVRHIIGAYSDGTAEMATVEQLHARLARHNGRIPVELRFFW
jgi:hypothetical protein